MVTHSTALVTLLYQVPAKKVALDDNTPHRKLLKRESAPFDNVVFVLIDALRSDNVFPIVGQKSPMPFVQECVKNGKAIGMSVNQ